MTITQDTTQTEVQGVPGSTMTPVQHDVLEGVLCGELSRLIDRCHTLQESAAGGSIDFYDRAQFYYEVVSTAAMLELAYPDPRPCETIRGPIDDTIEALRRQVAAYPAHEEAGHAAG